MPPVRRGLVCACALGGGRGRAGVAGVAGGGGCVFFGQGGEGEQVGSGVVGALASVDCLLAHSRGVVCFFVRENQQL